MFALIGAVLWTALPGEASARRWRRRAPKRVRLGMRTAPLAPAWVHSTEALEEAPDAPHESGGVVSRGGIAASRLKGGVTKADCLRELRRLRIRYRRVKPRRGIWLPVELTGPIHGVTYKALYTKQPPLVDCQFALGLERAARILAGFGVTTVLYTSTWRPPPSRSWRRIGHHPQGMAMDVNEVKLRDGTHLVVLKDWEKQYGGPGNCVGRPKTRKGRLWREMTCALERAHIFRRILSPDADFAHKNHWHISGAEIGDAFTRSRWAGRTLGQPLPGTKGFSAYYYWYSCWKFANPRTRYRCYRRRARRKPRRRGGFRMPRQKPKVAIWLRSQLKSPAAPVPAGAKAVELPPDPPASGAGAVGHGGGGGGGGEAKP